MKKEFRELLKEKGRTELPSVLLVSAECAPLAKAGGLADVVGTLPKALKKLGIDARVIMPYHHIIKSRWHDRVEHMCWFTSRFDWREVYVGVEKLVLDGVTVYLIDNEEYFGDYMYRGGRAEIEQYAYFTRAVLDAIPVLDFRPEILHCNDWQAGLIPLLARTQYPGGMQESFKFLLTIHNIAYQGKWDFGFLQYLLGIDERFYTPEFIELNGCADFLKAGCVFSDRLNTVSPSYAEEIKTPYYAEGLEGILNARSGELSGIVNGIDTDVFNPRTDPHIAANYSRGRLKGKQACKRALQERLGLEQRADVPLFAMVTRMTEQKGFDLIAAVIDDAMANSDMQFVLLGTGDCRFEDFMRGAEARWKGRLCAYIGYNDELAHQIYAGSDFYVMPSRFEPCGISQMLAMRYGSVPIVRETGGLRDTVRPYNKFTGEGTGFSFANYSADELKDKLFEAMACYRDDEIMKGLIGSAMGEDFAFDRSAEEYARLYLWLL